MSIKKYLRRFYYLQTWLYSYVSNLLGISDYLFYFKSSQEIPWAGTQCLETASCLDWAENL